MSRRKTARELNRQLQFAQAREAYTPPQREEGAATQRRPKIAVQYKSCIVANTEYTVQASRSSVQFFGGATALGLADGSADPTPPQGFKPCRIMAMVADASPAIVRARGSNRPYTRYARGARGSGTQSSFTAPISGAGTTVTVTDVRTRFNTVADAIRSSLGGGYGRVWFELERLPLVESGE